MGKESIEHLACRVDVLAARGRNGLSCAPAMVQSYEQACLGGYHEDPGKLEGRLGTGQGLRAAVQPGSELLKEGSSVSA